MKVILKALWLLAILLVATISFLEAYSLDQRQTEATIADFTGNQTTPQATETPKSTPSPTPKPVLSISDIKLSQWTSNSQDSVVIIDSPASNGVYASSAITLTIHAKAQSQIILIDVSMTHSRIGQEVHAFLTTLTVDG